MHDTEGDSFDEGHARIEHFRETGTAKMQARIDVSFRDFVIFFAIIAMKAVKLQPPSRRRLGRANFSNATCRL